MTLSGGVIHVGTGVHTDSLTKSVLGVGVGTEESAVRTRLGAPFAKVRARREICWAYHADQGGGSTTEFGTSSLDAIDFCMSPNGRVARISLGVHG